MSDLATISPLKSAVVFVNPAAGGGRAHILLPRIQKVFEAASVLAEFVSIENSTTLESNVLDAIRNGKQTLVAFGGDGTVQALVNAAYGSDIVFGVIPAGGGNDFAVGLSLPKDPVTAAEVIVQGHTKLVDIAQARTADGRERYFLGGGGVGIDADAAKYANATFCRLPGRSRYIVSALRALAGFKPIGVRVEFLGSVLAPLECKSLLTAVLNTPTYGAGIRLAPNATMDDGWLDAAVLEDLSFSQILALLPKFMMNGDLETSRVKRLRIQSIRITTDRPAMFHGDGEIIGPTPVEIEVVPQAIRVLVPAQS